MAINYIERLQQIKAPAIKIRQQFNDIVQKYGTLSDGASKSNGGYKIRINQMFTGVSEFNAGTTYIYNGDNSSNLTGSMWVAGSKDYTYFPLTARASHYNGLPSSSADTNGLHNLRGYLRTVSVADYVSGGDVHITREYIKQLVPNYYGSVSNAFLMSKTTAAPVDDLSRYSSYVVPLITWYYEDDEGNTVDLLTPLYFWYFFTPTGAKYKKGETASALGTQYIRWKFTDRPFTEPAYYAFSPPYVIDRDGTAARRDDLTTFSAFANGYVYTEWSDPDNYTTVVTGIDNAPYITLINAPANTPLDKITPIDNVVNLGISAIDIGYNTNPYDPVKLPNGKAGRFPAYRSEQDIIDLFADYGIKLYTDPEEAQVPPPSDDGKINPDNPSEPIPYYPDNSSDNTPIEQAYITPSTFGRACVYTPITTKRFLSWVCDSTVDVGNWSRLFANPVDVITGINLYNLDIVAHDAAHVALNAQTNILGVATNIPNYSILDGYNNIIDGGTLSLQAYYGNYADYTSMTYQMFIPFVGFTSLRACDVVNKTLRLYYAVDFATGSAVAFVNSDDKLIYTSPCTVAGKIPLSTSDRNSQMINNSLAVLGGLSGLLGGIASGNVGGGVGALMGGLGGLQLQTNYSNKGSLSAVNMYKLLPAFVERTRYDLFFPSGEQQYLGAKYQGAAGAPSTQFATLLNCVDAGGFVQSDVVYLTSQTATETEKQQIIDLIKSGIYL